MQNFIPYCTVTGITVWEFPYGEDESYPACVSLKLALSEKLLELCHNGVTEFFTNCEYGVSLWVAEALVAMRETLNAPVKVHIIIPHEEQAVKWNSAVRERYYDVHAAADTVTMLSTQYHEDCYADADHYMLDNSVMLLTVGDNAPLADYAKSKEKRTEEIKLPILL